MSIKKRFFDKVSKHENGCWYWVGATNSKGYGVFSIKAKPVYAHRFIYEREHGNIPRGMIIRHSCHNRRCVNPEHLSIGTQEDNTHDAIAIGRISKLNSAIVVGIMNSIETNAELGRSLGIDSSNVSRIRNGKTWSRAYE